MSNLPTSENVDRWVGKDPALACKYGRASTAPFSPGFHKHTYAGIRYEQALAELRAADRFVARFRFACITAAVAAVVFLLAVVAGVIA